MANEYDFMLSTKPMAQWDAYFRIVQEHDPYQHLRSIHNGEFEMNYDHTKPWITHVCVQHWDVKKVKEWRKKYRKPVINDECEYEGNIPLPWGSITAQELVHRFWIMVTNGDMPDTEKPTCTLKIFCGGQRRHLTGRKLAADRFLQTIMKEGPDDGLEPMEASWEWTRVSGGMNGEYRVFYFGEHQPAAWSTGLPKGVEYTVEVIDTWNMTITPLEGTFKDAAEIPLPGKPYIAVRIRPEKHQQKVK
jgi:hypothetical protein